MRLCKQYTFVWWPSFNESSSLAVKMIVEPSHVVLSSDRRLVCQLSEELS